MTTHQPTPRGLTAPFPTALVTTPGERIATQPPRVRHARRAPLNIFPSPTALRAVPVQDEPDQENVA
jgi:hypothetical protein